jgi:hypothetical protein
MPNKHFCQGPLCHTRTTQDRFLKSRGVIRGRYAYLNLDRTLSNSSYYDCRRSKYFCSQACKIEWLNETWKTLNKVDRLSLSDTDERAKVMPRSRMKIIIMGQVILFKGLTMDS